MSKIEEITGSTSETPQDDVPKFTPEEISVLVEEANTYKAAGNTLFGRGDYTDAIVKYREALNTCPVERVEERAVYWGNIGICEIKLGNYAQAVDACTKALEDSPTYTKALLRRAQANEKIGSLAALTSAQEDYKILNTDATHQSSLTPQFQKQVSTSLSHLPAQISEATEREKAEMIGKLKDLGNMFLGKFGLSTDNFQMVKNEQSGGYNVQFVGNSSTSNGNSDDGGKSGT